MSQSMQHPTAHLFQLLSDGQLHSGTELARQLNMTRSAVWKQIQHLEACGLPVEHQPRRGYRLFSPLQVLQAHRLQEQLRPLHPELQVQVLWQCDSTQQAARQQLQQSGMTSAVFCECQQAGRGRRGKSWQSLPGASLTFSLATTLQQPMLSLQGLPLRLGLACIQALHALGHESVKLKWPNDLIQVHLGQWQKLGGLLVEVSGELEGPVHIVAGLGLNLNLPPDLLRQIDQPCTNLSQTESVDRHALAASLVSHLLQSIQDCAQHGFEQLVDPYNRHHALHGQPVRVLQGSEVLFGRVAGVNTHGNLLLRTTQGDLTLSMGEISVRPYEEPAD